MSTVALAKVEGLSSAAVVEKIEPHRTAYNLYPNGGINAVDRHVILLYVNHTLIKD